MLCKDFRMRSLTMLKSNYFIAKGRGGKMDGTYTFEVFKQNLDDGYQIYFTYVRNRYLLFKTAENCYTQKLLTDNPKNPQPRHSMITYKRVKEMFPHMEQIEYKIGLAE